MPSTRFGVMLLLAASLNQDTSLVLSLKYKESNGFDVSPDTDHSIVRASKRVLWSSPGSSLVEGLKDDSGDDDEDDDSEFAEAGPYEGAEDMVKQTVANALPTAAFMQAANAEFGKISAASAKELGDLYVKMNSQVHPEFLHKLHFETPEIIHKIHFKGQLYYPHMHVANHRIVKVDTKPATGLSASAFLGKPSMFEDDRVTLTLVCFVLIALSGFFNMRSKVGKSLNVGHGEAASDGGLISVWDGTIATFSSILGMGFLSLPHCMSLAGWIAAPLMVFFTCCGGYTAHLLVWAMRQEMTKASRQGKTPMPGWGFLLHAAYGPSAERFINMFLVVELWGYVLSGIVATAMNLNQLVDEISVSSAVGLTVLIQYILTNVPGKALTRINLVCNALFIACCFMYIMTGLLLPHKAPSSELKYVKPEGLLAACGIIVFSPCSHSLYPAIMQRMEEPEKYPICIRRAYVLACIAYVSLAVPGYYLFGDAAQPSAVRNIGADINLVALPNLGWMNSVAAFCMVMKMSGLQPLILNPLNSTIESMLQGWAPKLVTGTLVAPTVLTVSAVVAMHFADQMATLLNLVGSIFCMTIALVLPVLCYWKLKPGIGCMQQALFSGLIVMGGTFAVLGLLTALDS